MLQGAWQSSAGTCTGWNPKPLIGKRPAEADSIDALGEGVNRVNLKAKTFVAVVILTQGCDVAVGASQSRAQVGAEVRFRHEAHLDDHRGE